MKKTLLLSIVAASAVMAGGNVAAPVAPVVAAASAWDFTGTAKVYFQSEDLGLANDAGATASIFDKASNAAAAGLQLGATNTDLVAGIGAGVQVSGISSLNLEDHVVSNLVQSPGALTGSWISQAYLTYGIGNTSVKVGRQELPQSLSPMAYSENWNVFANTYDAVVAVNSDIQDTTVVAAWVKRLNQNGMNILTTTAIPTANNMSNFDSINGSNGVYMLTVQNKSIENVTLTGSYYSAEDFGTHGNTSIYWLDAQTSVSGVNVGAQTFKIDFGTASDTDADGYGFKANTDVAGYTVAAAYSKVNDTYAHAFGTTTSAMYTSTALDQVKPSATTYTNEEKYVVSASRAALGGNVTLAYADSQNDASNYTEIDAVYSTALTTNTDLVAAYVNADHDVAGTINLVRVVASYKF